MGILQLGDLRSPWSLTTYESWDDPPSRRFKKKTPDQEWKINFLSKHMGFPMRQPRARFAWGCKTCKTDVFKKSLILTPKPSFLFRRNAAPFIGSPSSHMNVQGKPCMVCRDVTTETVRMFSGAKTRLFVFVGRISFFEFDHLGKPPTLDASGFRAG